MTDAERFAQRLSENLVKTKIGSLRFWGQWFGRPYAANHRIMACDGKRDLLRLRFNEGEMLSIWSPKDMESSKLKFRIADAARIKWEWFSYGRPKIPANLYFLDFIRERGSIVADTNWTLSELCLEPSETSPAVEILSRADGKN